MFFIDFFIPLLLSLECHNPIVGLIDNPCSLIDIVRPLLVYLECHNLHVYLNTPKLYNILRQILQYHQSCQKTCLPMSPILLTILVASLPINVIEQHSYLYQALSSYICLPSFSNSFKIYLFLLWVASGRAPENN